MKSMFVYILECSDRSYYIGMTNNYELRFYQHQIGLHSSCYTFKRRPLILRRVETFDSPWSAIVREKQLKRWSKAKKRALIENDERELGLLSHNRTGIITVRHGSAGSP
jgi:putative endonuclease